MSNRRVERDKGKGAVGESTNKRHAESAAKQRAERRRNRGSADQADWSSANAALLHRLIISASRVGAAVQFGLTRDGGAFRIRVLDGGESDDVYVRPTEDIDIALETLAIDFEED